MRKFTCLKEMVTSSFMLCTVYARLHEVAVVECDLSGSPFETGVTEILRL